MLELALVVPILALLAFAIFQFAFVLESQVGLTNAVREAARRAAATEPSGPPTWSGPGSLAEWVQAQLCGDAVSPCDGGLLQENVQAFDGARLAPDPPTVSFCRYSIDIAGTPENQYRVEVTAQYGHPVFFGPMAFATDFVDGNTNGSWDIAASAQMRLEHIDDTDPMFVDPGACP